MLFTKKQITELDPLIRLYQLSRKELPENSAEGGIHFKLNCAAFIPKFLRDIQPPEATAIPVTRMVDDKIISNLKGVFFSYFGPHEDPVTKIEYRRFDIQYVPQKKTQDYLLLYFRIVYHIKKPSKDLKEEYAMVCTNMSGKSSETDSKSGKYDETGSRGTKTSTKIIKKENRFY